MQTRSQRRQVQSQRPSYPHVLQQSSQSATSSTSSSVFQSSSSLNSVNGSSMRTHNSPSLYAKEGAYTSAPLPSPSSAQPQAYFDSWRHQHQHQYQHQHQHQAPQPHPSQQQQQRMAQMQTVAASYQGQRAEGGSAPATTPYLRDFSLVAEAAKRAQMACLTRDLGDVGL